MHHSLSKGFVRLTTPAASFPWALVCAALGGNPTAPAFLFSIASSTGVKFTWATGHVDHVGSFSNLDRSKKIEVFPLVKYLFV